ncbi:MAG: hypothetical protein Q8Q09_22570, partial [Deltaproteobacteria bacterium]|nr:hypothetical protein [Deltaproteobacteria bacterium]
MVGGCPAGEFEAVQIETFDRVGNVEPLRCSAPTWTTPEDAGRVLTWASPETGTAEVRTPNRCWFPAEDLGVMFPGSVASPWQTNPALFANVCGNPLSLLGGTCDSLQRQGPNTVETPERRYPWARGLQCQKPLFADAQIVVLGSNESDAIVQARPYLGAQCALRSPDTLRELPALPPLPGGTAFTCFARNGTGVRAVGRANPRYDNGSITGTAGSIIGDPGTHPFGDQYVTAPAGMSTTSTIRVSDHNDPSKFTDVVVQGTAASRLLTDRFVLTDLALTQVGTSQYVDNGTTHTLSLGRAQIDWLWNGPWNSATSRYELTQDSVKIQGEVRVNGTPYRFNPGATAIATVVGTAAQYTIDANFRSTGTPDVDVAMHLVLNRARLRPTATITAITPSATPECTGSAAAMVSVTATPVFNGPASGRTWVVGADQSLRDTDTISVSIPMRATSSEAGHRLVYYAYSDPLAATAGTEIRTVDTTPPTSVSQRLALDGRLGCKPSMPDRIAVLCDANNYLSQDTCFGQTGGIVDSVTAYDAAGNIAQSFTCNGQVDAPLASNDPSLRFEVRWRGIDPWGNSTATRATRVHVRSDSNTAGCGMRNYALVTTYDGLLSSAPAWNFTALRAAELQRLPAGSASISSLGLKLLRASGATVQVSATQIVSAIASNTARIGDDGLGHRGLVLEEARTNLVAHARSVTAATWTAGLSASASENVAVGPDGQSLADRVTVASAGYSRYVSIGNLQGNYVASAWQAAAGTGTTFHLRNQENAAGSVVYGTLGAAFGRREVRHLYTNGWSYLVAADGRDTVSLGGTAAAARDVFTDFHQLEAGRFATEAIVTTGSTATRAGEQLQASSTALWIDQGRLSIELRVQPKGG